MITILLAAIAQAAVSAWTVNSKPDPMTDAREITATLPGQGGKLVLMCSTDGSNPVLLFHSDKFLGGGIGRHELRDFYFRFDNRPMVRTSWKYLRNMVVAPSNKELRAFVQQMSSASQLRVRATSYDNSTQDGYFVLTGKNHAMATARSACYQR